MSRRDCPACGSTFIKGRRVLLIERDYSSPEPSESITAVARIVCRGCAKLAQPSPRFFLIPDQVEEERRKYAAAVESIERDEATRRAQHARELAEKWRATLHPCEFKLGNLRCALTNGHNAPHDMRPPLGENELAQAVLDYGAQLARELDAEKST